MTLGSILEAPGDTRLDPHARTLRESLEERRMLLELATDLRKWPARNVVFKQALEVAACDLVRLAREYEGA